MNFEIFCLHVTGYLNTKKSFPICMFVVMASEKCELHTCFTILHEILTSTHMKNLIFFCIVYVAMSNIHFSVLDNVKITFQTHKYHSFLHITVRKNMIALTFVDLENETSISIYEFEMMNVLK